MTKCPQCGGTGVRHYPAPFPGSEPCQTCLYAEQRYQEGRASLLDNPTGSIDYYAVLAAGKREGYQHALDDVEKQLNREGMYGSADEVALLRSRVERQQEREG